MLSGHGLNGHGGEPALWKVMTENIYLFTKTYQLSPFYCPFFYMNKVSYTMRHIISYYLLFCHSERSTRHKDFINFYAIDDKLVMFGTNVVKTQVIRILLAI